MDASPMLVKPGMALTKDGSNAAMVTSTSATTIGVTYLVFLLLFFSSFSSFSSSGISVDSQLAKNVREDRDVVHPPALLRVFVRAEHQIKPSESLFPKLCLVWQNLQRKRRRELPDAIFFFDATKTFHSSSDNLSFRSNTTPRDSFGSFSQCSMEALFSNASFLSFTGTRIVFFARNTL